MNSVVAAVVAGALLAGCATVQDTPKNLANSWTDPERRSHSAERIVEGAVGVGAGIGTYLLICKSFRGKECKEWWHHVVAVGGGMFTGVLAELLIYEFVFEPAGWGGHYWERGSRNPRGFRKP